MDPLELAYFGFCTLLVLLGGAVTAFAKNPIRGAMGLAASIVGIAGLYLMLSAELLAAIQILVYAGAVVILFLFVIMILGPSATSPHDTRSSFARYLGAGVFLLSAVSALWLVLGANGGATTTLPAPPAGFGTIESLGRELFTTGVVPFELSGALLLIAVVGAVAVARGKQIDPTLGEAPAKPALPAPKAAPHGHGSEAAS